MVLRGVYKTYGIVKDAYSVNRCFNMTVFHIMIFTLIDMTVDLSSLLCSFILMRPKAKQVFVSLFFM